MGNIKLDGKIIPDRRNGNGRIRLDTGDWMKIATVIIALILTGGRMQLTVANNSKAIEGHKNQIDINTNRITKVENEITNIKDNLIYIRNKVDEIKLKIK